MLYFPIMKRHAFATKINEVNFPCTGVCKELNY